MTFEFRPAKRENVGTLIGLAGGTGSGKTWTGFELAAGLAGDKPFAVLDTEARRALHYADAFRFDHADLRPPFTPDRYIEAILSADAAGYPVIMVDSASHEHAGEGGLLDWHDQEVERIVERKREFAERKKWNFDEYKEREAANIAAWIEPKAAHKRFVQQLLQLRAHLILCFRAEEKIEIVKLDDDGNVVKKGGKTTVRPKVTATGRDGWVPICEKNLPFELTCSFLLKADRPGVGVPIKLPRQLQHLFPEGKQIGRAAGEGLAAWARGGSSSTPNEPRDTKPSPTPIPSAATDDLVKRIGAAKSADELAAVGAEAKQLERGKFLVGDEATRVRNAFKTRQAELAKSKAKPPPEDPGYGPPPMSDDEAREAEEALNP
jgi:hypothetical protein